MALHVVEAGGKPAPSPSHKMHSRFEASSQERWADRLRVPGIIGSWYLANILVLLLNKYLLAYFGFKMPIMLTACHMLACSVLGHAANSLGLYPLARIQSMRQLSKIVALAGIFCFSLACGNASLRFIPVSFTQAIGATTPFFTAFLMLALTSTREAGMVYLSLVPVVVGIAIATGADPSFNMLGFGLAVGATCSRALKSVIQGLLLEDHEKLDSLSLLTYMSTLSLGFLLPAVALLEQKAFTLVPQLTAQHAWFIPMLALNSVLAWAVNLTNFLVTKATSPLTLQVLGNAKGVVAALVSVLIFKNPVSVVGCGGYLITVAGVFGYSQAKRRAKEQQQRAADKRTPKLLSPVKQASGEDPEAAYLLDGGVHDLKVPQLGSLSVLTHSGGSGNKS